MLGSFAYEAVDARGKRMRGQAEAGSAAALVRSLEERGLFVLQVEEAEEAPRRRGFARGRRRAVLEVTRAVAALLQAGMPLARALSAAGNVAGPGLTEAIASVRARVERGEPLASALGRHPELFPPVYVGMVRAGERSGSLAAAFAGLADQLEREEEIRAKLLSASIYPLVLAAAGGLAIVVLLVFVLPRFVGLLGESGAELPGSTALLLDLSSAVRRYWPVLLAAGVAAGLLAAGSRTSEGGRRAGAALLLRLPLVGSLRRDALAARFARLTGVLLTGGAPLLAALEDAHRSLDDPLARDEVARIRARVREGSSLHRAIGEGGLFPPLLAQLVAVGEEASRLREFLLKAAETLERRTERTVQRLVTLAEPAMILVFGAMVAFVALSLLQAIYGVNADVLR